MQNKGFTLVELLIVIAILGILVIGLIAAINPAEKIAVSQDTLRKSHINSLGKAVYNYLVINSSYFSGNTSWMDNLISSGDLKFEPQNPDATGGCGTNPQNGYCYSRYTPSGGTNNEVIIFAQLLSNAEKTACTNLYAGSKAFFVWSSVNGKACRICQLSSYPGLAAQFTANNTISCAGQ